MLSVALNKQPATAATAADTINSINMSSMSSATMSYLNETVGALLSQGVSTTLASNPADPVEFLAEWLLRRVQADEQREQQAKHKKQQHDQELRQAAQEQEEQKEKDAALAKQAAAIQGLSTMLGDPQDLWQAAVQLAKTYTSAAAVYVANIVEEEQPPWTAPDDPEADVETEDESATAAEGEGEGGDAAAEADAGEGEGGEGKGTDEDAAGGSGSGSSADYSTKLLRYVAASAGQEFLTALELRRPTKADEEGSSGGDGADAQKPEAVPVTFRVLDEKLPLLEVPAVAAEPRVKFLKGPPRVGGYAAVAVPSGPAGCSSGTFQAVLAADSLLPEGHGQGLSAGDVSVLWEIAQALGKALDAAAGVKKTEAARGGGSELLSALTASLQQIRQAAAAPAPVPEVGEEPAQPEGEGGEGGAELTPAEAVSHAEAELAYAGQVIAAGKVTVENAAAALAVEKEALTAIVKVITGVRGTALRALKLCTSSPPATFHVLRAVLLLLGRQPAEVATWREVSQHLHMGLFEQVVGYDATQERDAARWKLVRAAFKAVQNPKALERELPQCALGSMLLAWIKQVRAVARRAAALREAEKQLAAAEAGKTLKEGQLTAAKEAQVKAEADEAAAAQAAAEAEAAEAAAAEDGEGQDEEEGQEE